MADMTSGALYGFNVELSLVRGPLLLLGPEVQVFLLLIILQVVQNESNNK